MPRACWIPSLIDKRGGAPLVGERDLSIIPPRGKSAVAGRGETFLYLSIRIRVKYRF